MKTNRFVASSLIAAAFSLFASGAFAGSASDIYGRSGIAQSGSVLKVHPARHVARTLGRSSTITLRSTTQPVMVGGLNREFGRG